MAEYDDGEITPREELAAERQKEIAKSNAAAVNRQLNRQLTNYTYADEQNRKLAQNELKQASRKTETDRFEANRNLQNAALGLLGSLGTGGNSSTVGNLMYLLRNRNDADNNTYWQQLMDNQNTITNAYEESLNQNNLARNEAQANAEKALLDIENDLAANLANINPNLYEPPGTGSSDLGVGLRANDAYRASYVNDNPVLSGYVMPENAEQNVRSRRNKVNSGYYGQLMNRFNGRL